ncbi:MAG TPA: endo alpha-1,4 polygalactosaminidase [Polyangiaceae bacterium]|nr:endo alpha-1,4 polygalactosaminidase [Polyangiaceae bacterium]
MGVGGVRGSTVRFPAAAAALAALLGLGCSGGDEGGICGWLPEEDAQCAAYPEMPAFHVCETDEDEPPTDECVSLGDSGDYCCPEGYGSGAPPSGPGLDPDVEPSGEAAFRPAVTTTWQWQLSGPLNASYPVELYDVDLFDTDAATIAALQAAGQRVVCYFSAGSGEDWRPDYGDLAPAALGEGLEGWAGERWLDVTEPTVLEVALARLDLAVEKGCDGVEPDNVDGYQNASGFQLTAAHQLGFNRRLGNEAHARGLAVLLKNDLAQIEDLLDYFDGALNEECFAYEECALLAPFPDVDKPVLQVEYADDAASAERRAAAVCADARAASFRTLVLPWDLDDGFRVSCDE